MSAEPTPDGVPCRNCNQPISWDEICWTHDHSGFADCSVVILPGTGQKIGSFITLDPQFATDMKYKDKRAEPVGEWS